MTEPLPLPPLSDPRSRLTWALRTLDVFSQPSNRDALGADNLRNAARAVLVRTLDAHPNLKWEPSLRKHRALWNRHLEQERQEHLEATKTLQRLDLETLLRMLDDPLP